MLRRRGFLIGSAFVALAAILPAGLMSGHRHKDSRGLWTSTAAEPEIAHPADTLTDVQVKALLLLVGGAGGTTPPTQTVPSAPASLTVTPGNALENLAWTVPTVIGGTPITGYHVYRDGSSLVTLGVVLAYQDTGRTNGVSYSYTVAAINAIGEGAQSASVAATPVAPSSPTAPGVVQSLAGVGTNATASLSWAAPASNGGSVVTGYRIYQGAALIASQAGLSKVVNGLTNGSAYSFSVSAVNAVGEGAKVSVSVTPVGSTTTVASIAALKTALLDNSLDEIVVTNGTYSIDVAQNQTTNSLFIGGTYASRTRPVTVRPTSSGGVIFDGGGTIGNHAMMFANGSHHQTWDGFKFANIAGNVLLFGGFTPVAPSHDITLRNITIMASCHRLSSGSNQEHCIYLANALTRGPYNLLFEDLTFVGTDSLCLWGGIHGFHGDASNPPPDHVTIRRLTTTGLFNPIVPWYDTSGANMHDWLFDGATISGAREYAIRFESVGASNIVFKDITSTTSTLGGFYSSMGANPPGVTKTNCSLA